MTKHENLHELTRDALAHVRGEFPDPIVDVEHRGEGDCELDGPVAATAIAAVLSAGLTALDRGESMWMRSSGVDATVLTVELRWTGEEPDAARWMAAVASATGSVEVAGEGRERRVRLVLPRH